MSASIAERRSVHRRHRAAAVRVPPGIDEREVRAAYPLSPVIAVTAIGRALRALGAKADIGAAVEAAVSALEI